MHAAMNFYFLNLKTHPDLVITVMTDHYDF